MQSEMSAQQVYTLVCKAVHAYADSDVNSVSRLTRVHAMYKYITAIKKQSPQKKVIVTLEDYLLLTELPE